MRYLRFRTHFLYEIEYFWMVPRAGVEPAQYFYRGILSPLRLPISPPGHRWGVINSDWFIAASEGATLTNFVVASNVKIKKLKWKMAC